MTFDPVGITLKGEAETVGQAGQALVRRNQRREGGSGRKDLARGFASSGAATTRDCLSAPTVITI